MSLLAYCEWLAATEGSIALHESMYMYPLVESSHVLALMLFVGFATILDLRLLGLILKGVPVSQVAERLLPWTIAGFVVMCITGVLLFSEVRSALTERRMLGLAVAVLLGASWVVLAGKGAEAADAAWIGDKARRVDAVVRDLALKIAGCTGQ
jgi:hypothetical protein